MDLIVAPLGITLNRINYISYLPPIEPYGCGLYIPLSFYDRENLDFTLLLKILSIYSWIGVIMITLFVSLLKIWLHYNYKTSLKLTEHFHLFWSTLMAFFGGGSPKSRIDAKPPYRITVFVFLLCTVLVWIHYRANLNAQLAVRLKRFPFNSMESLSNTDWK